MGKVKAKIKMHFVYIVECRDNTLYVGCTNNLDKRLFEHNNSKRGAHYTKIRRPVRLVYNEKYRNLAAGRRREAEIKRLTRQSKEKLFR